MVWLLVLVAIAVLDVAAVGVLAPNVRGLTKESVVHIQGLAGAVPFLLAAGAGILALAALVAVRPIARR